MHDNKQQRWFKSFVGEINESRSAKAGEYIRAYSTKHRAILMATALDEQAVSIVNLHARSFPTKMIADAAGAEGSAATCNMKSV